MVDFKVEVPFFDASAPYLSQQNELDAAIHKVLTSGAFINGEEVGLFSSNLASYLNIAHVIPCANGTDALSLALMALNLKKGDEVIVPAFNFIAAAEAVALLGLVPVFIDANEYDFNIDCSLIENSITEKTKAIIVVHLFGAAAQMDNIIEIAKRHQLAVVEDVAQSLGSEYHRQKLGTFGDIACTSFFPTKNLACFGDGGAIFTKDPVLAKRLKMLANHGQIKKYEHEIVGLNSRLDTLQAAILYVKLEQLDQAINTRRKIANYYNEHLNHLNGIQLPIEANDTFHSFNQYCILLENKSVRDVLKAYLQGLGISTMVYYPKSNHEQKAFTVYGYVTGDFPVSESLCSRILALPVFPSLTLQQQSYIVQNIKNYLENVG